MTATHTNDGAPILTCQCCGALATVMTIQQGNVQSITCKAHRHGC